MDASSVAESASQRPVIGGAGAAASRRGCSDGGGKGGGGEKLYHDVVPSHWHGGAGRGGG